MFLLYKVLAIFVFQLRNFRLPSRHVSVDLFSNVIFNFVE